MNRSRLPPLAFLDPGGENRAQIQTLARRILELVLQSGATASSRAPLEVKPFPFPVSLPDEPVPEKEILEKLDAIVAGSMNAAHPGWIGHMDTIPTTLSVLGDFAASALNNNLLSREMAPTLTELESRIVKAFAQLFGLSGNAGGVLVSGGSLANLEALAVARNVRCGAMERGLAGASRRPVILASEAAHSSIQKAAMLLGLGTSGVLPVVTNANSQMDRESLKRQIRRAEVEGALPFCVVATAGTTVTGNIDPLADVHRIAREHGLWFHVDAAYGGALMLSPNERHRLSGIQYADSITFNAHKWLYVAKTCAMALFSDARYLESDFRIAAPYMDRGEGTNLGELSVQGTRHADVLKLWLSLQHIGRAGYAHLIDEAYALTRAFVRDAKTRSFLELASEPETNVVCFRGAPNWLEPAQWDRWNTELQKHLLEAGNTFLSLPTYRGHRWLRAVLLNPFTDESVIAKLFERIDAFALKTIHDR